MSKRQNLTFVTSRPSRTTRQDVAAHGLSNEAQIRFSNPPGGLDNSTNYYVTVIDPNTITVSNTTPGGAAANVTFDGSVIFFAVPNGSRNIWDTIDDFNANGALLTLYPNADVPAGSTWSSDNLCVGIEAVTDDSNVWKNVSVDGPDGDSIGCSSSDDECAFLDKISGLTWSELRFTSRTWSQALSDCDDLGNSPQFAGNDDWRLPTQKEIMDAYNHGMRSAGTANWLTSGEMSAWFWSASSVSNLSDNAWAVIPVNGNTNYYGKDNLYRVFCVR